MKKTLANSSFLLVTHKQYHGVADDLKRYLLEHKAEVWIIGHEFASLPTRRSSIEHYNTGRLVKQRYSRNFSWLPEPLINFKDFLYTIWWMVFRVRKVDIYFGFGGVNVMSGLLLQSRLKIKKIIYYTIDFVPKRFNGWLLNEIYHWLDRQALSGATVTWNLSPRMAEAREKLRGLTRARYSRQDVVPVGVWLKDMPSITWSKVHKRELVFVGILLEKQGVQLVIQAIPEIVKKIPQFRFRVIGSGEYENNLHQLVEKLNLKKYVIFEGAVYDQAEVNRKLSKAAIGVAMYDKKTDTFTRFADPTKIKTYLACGLPVILTDVPYNAREVEGVGAGKVIDYTVQGLVESITQLMGDSRILENYHNNARKYMEQYDWNAIFDRKLFKLLDD